MWELSTSFDPQVVFIITVDSPKNYTLRTITFSKSKSFSIYTDFSKTVAKSLIDSLQLNNLWQLRSQSDMTESDSYGCLDGSDLFIEIANTSKYKFLWYKCPEFHKDKDTAFFITSTLSNRLNALQVTF